MNSGLNSTKSHASKSTSPQCHGQSTQEEQRRLTSVEVAGTGFSKENSQSYVESGFPLSSCTNGVCCRSQALREVIEILRYAFTRLPLLIINLGIGAAICENLASKGCSLVMNYTSDSSAEKTEKLAKQLETNNSVRCLPVQADLGSENGPAHIITTALNHLAHPKTRKLQIDIVVNNAGVAGKTKIEDCTADEFAFLYNVNVRGPLFLMKAVIPYLPYDRSGRVVNLSSVSASMGFLEDGMYGGTKAALEAMTRTWARELSERCTVNAVNPGPVATDMYAEAPKEFQGKMAAYTSTTPLAAIRPELDRKDLVDGAEFAGGRPVSKKYPILLQWLIMPFSGV